MGRVVRSHALELVLSCLVSLECTLGGLFLAHAAAGLHYTVQSTKGGSLFYLRRAVASEG